MRLPVICSIVLVTSCATRSSAPVAASLPTVNPDRDVAIVPKFNCIDYAGWIARTVDAEKLSQMKRIDALAACNARATKADGAAKLANERANEAEKRARQLGWLSEYGFPIGFGLGAAIAGAVVCTILCRH